MMTLATVPPMKTKARGKHHHEQPEVEGQKVQEQGWGVLTATAGPTSGSISVGPDGGLGVLGVREAAVGLEDSDRVVS